MYNIAICDDEEKSIKETMSLLSSYNNDNSGIDWEIDVFKSSLDLLDAMEKKAYDVYVLDIYLY